jgi:hypothetical protein
LTAGIPGTGVRYQENLSSGKPRKTEAAGAGPRIEDPVETPATFADDGSADLACPRCGTNIHVATAPSVVVCTCGLQFSVDAEAP